MTESQKQSIIKWDKANMTKATVNMPKWELELLQKACERDGITVHSIFLAAAKAEIMRHADLAAEAKFREPDEKPGRKPDGYNEAMFAELYDKVQSGEMKAAEAADRLGIHLRKWYRLAKARKKTDE